MSRDLICGIILSITTSNVVWCDKNVKTTFQKKVVEKGGVDNTYPQSKIGFAVEDYRLEGRITI
jgi:hypothetical protein